MTNISNHKLSEKIVSKILKDKVEICDNNGNISLIHNISNTGSEIDFLIYLSSIQDEFGKVYRVFYKDVAFSLGISYPTFYSIIDRLVVRNYIQAEQGSDGYWNFTILDNIFLNDSFKTPYLNTNRAFLHSKQFISLPGKSKKIVLKLFMSYLKPNMERYGLKIRLEKLGKLIGVLDQSNLKRYLNAILPYFPFKLGHDVVRFEKGIIVFNEKFVESERAYSIATNLKSFCHKNKIPYCISDIKDLVFVINQYIQKGLSIRKIYAIIYDSLKTEGQVISKLINTILKYSISKKEAEFDKENSIKLIDYLKSKYSSEFINWSFRELVPYDI